MKQAHIPGIRGGWPAELAQAYEDEGYGHLSPGRVGKALSGLLRAWRRDPPSNPWGYSPDELLRFAFGRWMRSEKRKYGPELIARDPGEFLRGPGI